MATTEPAQKPPLTARIQAFERRRALLERLRRVASDLDTARCLERRADLSSSPALADVLRERAGERRRRAERLRAGLGPRAGLRTTFPPPA